MAQFEPYFAYRNLSHLKAHLDTSTCTIVSSYLWDAPGSIINVDGNNIWIFDGSDWFELEDLPPYSCLYTFRNFQFHSQLQISQYQAHDNGSHLWQTRKPNRTFHYEPLPGKQQQMGWVEKAPLNVKRFQCQFLQVGNKMYVWGGGKRQVERYNEAQNKWEVFSVLDQNYSAAIEWNGCIYFFRPNESGMISVVMDVCSDQFEKIQKQRFFIPTIQSVVKWMDYVLLFAENGVTFSLTATNYLSKCDIKVLCNSPLGRKYAIEKSTQFIY